MVQSQRFGIGNQVSVPARAEIGYPGQAIYVIEATTFHNSAADTQQTVAIAVGTAATDTAYSFTVGSRTVTITSAAAATQTTIRDQLVNAINGDAVLSGLYTVEATGPDAITLTHRLYGVNETVSVSGGGAGYAATPTAAGLSSLIPFGLAIVRGTGSVDSRPNGMLPNAAGQAVVGFTYAAASIPREPDSTRLTTELPGYRRGDPMSVIKKGILYCRAEVAITAGAPLFKRHTADGAFTQLGAIAGAAGTGLDAIAGAVAEEDSVTLGDGTIIVAVSANIT